MSAAPAVELHPFERAGLGVAPFRFLGIEHRVGPIRTQVAGGITVEVGAPGQPMGSCDYCGTSIAWCCVIVSADRREFIVGTDCVAKTSPALRDEVEAAAKIEKRKLERLKRTAAAAIAREKRAVAARETLAPIVEKFRAERPDVAAALKLEHPILADMARKLDRFGSLSEAQCAFALKLAAEVAAGPVVNVPAPEGDDITVEGEVVKLAWHDGPVYGSGSTKMTVKVKTAAGVYLVWVTVPANLEAEKGAIVRFRCSLRRGSDAHFAFGKRPRAAVVVRAAE